MTERLPTALHARIEMVEAMVADAKLTPAQRWHLRNALINLAREAGAEARVAGRLEGSGKALGYAMTALRQLRSPGRMDDMPAAEAFGWGKALAETAVILIGEQIERGGLSLAPHARTETVSGEGR